MNKQLILKPASESDFEFIWKLYSESVSTIISNQIKGGWNQENEEKKFLTTYNIKNTYVITQDGEKIGWLSGSESENEVHIENGFLLQSYRRKGIGTRVLTELKNMFQAKNKKITFSVLHNNPNKFFERFDFEIFEEDQLTKKIKFNF